MFKLLAYDCKEKNLTGISRDLPILLMSGSEDPVGNYGKGPKAVYDQYKKIGIKDVNLIMYEGFRHEPLNDTIRNEVYENIYSWIEAHL